MADKEHPVKMTAICPSCGWKGYRTVKVEANSPFDAVAVARKTTTSGGECPKCPGELRLHNPRRG